MDKYGYNNGSVFAALVLFVGGMELSEEDCVSDETFFLLKFIAKNSINI